MEYLDGEDWALVEGPVEAHLSAHRYLDDGDLLFERYRYCLSVAASDPRRLADSSEAALLRLVLDALHHRGFPCLLVFDLQYRDLGPGGEAGR